MRYFIENLRNNFDFFLRKNLKFSRKNYSEKSSDLLNLSEEESEFYNFLDEKYELSLLNNLSERNVLENIYFLEIFDKFFSKKADKNISVLDIGSKNWSYVKSEYLFFDSFSNQFSLNGIELDAYRLCSNFYTRYEIAKFYTKNLAGTNYIAGDFIEHNQKYDYIIWILPFITEYPLVKWGLPLRYFKPEEMLRHAYSLLNSGGELLIINQGEKEYKKQQGLNKEIPSMPIYYGEIEDRFNLFRNKRFGCKMIKN